MSFWHQLKKPIIVVAPMADVTDPAFRSLIAKYSHHERKNGSFGGPDVMWTEFVSADGLMRAPKEGKKKLRADLAYSDAERPIVAQLFSSHPEYMEGAAALVRELGFDGIDINMGCPDRSIEKQGCGAAMIRTPDIARAIIRAAKRGAGSIPVSVKTRLGYNRDELETWLPVLLSEEPAAIIVHARTRKDMSKVPARWERIKRAVEIRDAQKCETLILGNGDVRSVHHAYKLIAETGADGAMVGRGIFGNPWFFNPRINKDDMSLQEQFRVMIEHTKLFETLVPYKNFAIMKKHYKAYVHGFDGATELRTALMDATTSAEVEAVVNSFVASMTQRGEHNLVQ